jgi:hypothetical protein
MKASQDCRFWHEAKAENTSYFNVFFLMEERLHVAFPNVVMCWMHLKIAIALSKIVSCYGGVFALDDARQSIALS